MMVDVQMGLGPGFIQADGRGYNLGLTGAMHVVQVADGDRLKCPYCNPVFPDRPIERDLKSWRSVFADEEPHEIVELILSPMGPTDLDDSRQVPARNFF